MLSPTIGVGFPDPRMCLYPDEFKVPRSLKKALKERRFQIRVDQNFEEVIRDATEINALMNPAAG